MRLRTIPRGGARIPLIIAARDVQTAASEGPASRGAAFRWFFWLVVLGGVSALAASPLPLRAPVAPTLVLGVLMVCAELAPVWLPRGGYSTLSSIVDFTALLLLGPGVTVWLVVASTVLAQLVFSRRPLERVLFNAGLFAVMIWASGTVARLLGAVPGALELPSHLPAIGAAALVYYLVNASGMSLVLGLTQGLPPARIFQRNYLASAPVHLGNLAIGASFALIYVHVGLWGIAVVLAPLLAAGLGLRRYLQMRRDLLEFVRALAGVLEEVDPYTREHSIRVAEYAKRVAREMGVTERHIEDIEYGALLHDLGKIGRAYQNILSKPARLSDEEERLIRFHPDQGADIVARVHSLGRAAEYVRCHHERMDGRGYPRGLAGEALPRGARIIMVCDAFDAMTSDRAYRRAMSVDAALAELATCSGTQFDVDVVHTVTRLVRQERFPLLYRRAVEPPTDPRRRPGAPEAERRMSRASSPVEEEAPLAAGM